MNIAVCPICDRPVPIAHLQDHCEAHFQETSMEIDIDATVDLTNDDDDPSNPPVPQLTHPCPNNGDDVNGDVVIDDDIDIVCCSICGAGVALQELDSHEHAHAYEVPLTAAERDGDGDGDGDAAAQAIAERLEFHELRQKYGFDTRSRPGRCFTCGQEGHWSSDCPRNPANISAQQRIVPQPTPEAVAAAQRPDPQWQRRGGDDSMEADVAEFVQLLAARVAEQRVAGEYVKCRLLLCAPVAHFGGQQHDSGWGCGYRNMQMQVSHLLACRRDVRAALFCGAGIVPDVASLQAWIECAWKVGFDPAGAEQLGYRLQGGKKWVGTTEAAVLLRFFGLPAVIADFGVASPPRGDARALRESGFGNKNDVNVSESNNTTGNLAWNPPSSSSSVGIGKNPGSTSVSIKSGNATALPIVEVHDGVQCGHCGAMPIQGPRYRSRALPNYDLCHVCRQQPNADVAGPFQRMLATGMTSGAVTTIPRAGIDSIKAFDSATNTQKTLLAATPNGNNTSHLSLSSSSSAAAAATGGGDGGGGTAQQENTTNKIVENENGGKNTDNNPIKAPANSTDDNTSAGSMLLRWTWRYFSDQPSPSPSPSTQEPTTKNKNLRRSQNGKVCVELTDKPPLYFQHEGHSRTIIGIERKQRRDNQPDDVALYVLDPGTNPLTLRNALKNGQGWAKLIKRGARALKQSQFQVLWVDPQRPLAVPGSQDYESSKTIAATERY